MNEDLRSHATAKRTLEQQAERVQRFQKMMAVFDEVKQERFRQNEGWVNVPKDDYPVEVWMEAIENCCNVAGDEADIRQRFIEAAALAVAAVESMDHTHAQRVKEIEEHDAEKRTHWDGNEATL